MGIARFNRILRDRSAVAMTEFALAAPLLLTAGLYGLEMSNYAITNMKVSQIAMHVADNASRIGDTTTLTNRKIYEADINDLLVGAGHQAGNIDLYNHGRVILSSLETDPDDPTGTQQWIHWQRCMGNKAHPSSYGVENDGKGDPSFVGMGPAGDEVKAMQDDAVIFVEVAYDYQYIVTDAFISDRTITATSAFTVRDDRDLSQIYQVDPLNPDTAADCSVAPAPLVVTSAMSMMWSMASMSKSTAPPTSSTSGGSSGGKPAPSGPDTDGDGAVGWKWNWGGS